MLESKDFHWSMRDSIFLTFVHHFYNGLVKGTREQINEKALENVAQNKHHIESNTALFSKPTNGFTLPIVMWTLAKR